MGAIQMQGIFLVTSLLMLQAAGSSVKAGVDTATVGLEYAKNVRSPGQATISSCVDSTLAGSAPAGAVLALRVRGTTNPCDTESAAHSCLSLQP